MIETYDSYRKAYVNPNYIIKIYEGPEDTTFALLTNGSVVHILYKIETIKVILEAND